MILIFYKIETITLLLLVELYESNIQRGCDKIYCRALFLLV
jgi:hypothetical protein